MTEFKVGDRVKARDDLIKTGGNIGTILRFDNNLALIEYDKNVNGHNRGGKDGHCWWEFFTDLIKLSTITINETEMERFL